MVAVMALAFARPAAAGEYLILESTAPELRAGDVAPAGTAIEVPREAQVTLVASSGGVLRIEGPWRGTLDAPADGGESLIGRLVALLQSPAPRSQLGATRSAGNCIAVDLEQDRDVCVSGSSCIMLQSRQPVGEQLVIDAPDARMVEASPAPGYYGWSWPQTLDVKPGTYRIWTAGAAAPTELRLHRQPELPSRAHAIAWMNESGCTKQAQDALERLAQ